MHNPPAMHVAIYARFSSDNQREVSIDDQVRKCREFAASKNWTVAENRIYTDYAMSGVGSDRPGLKALLERAYSPEPDFSAILVDDSSRLSRNLADSINIQQRLTFNGVRLIAVSQGIDSADEQSEILLTVHGLVDSLFIKGIAQKTRRGLEGAVERGMHAGGTVYGYANVAVPGGGAKLRVLEEQAVIVRRIFEMAASGWSLKRIAKALNAEGIPSPRRKSKLRYNSWAPSAIHEIIRRERYLGRVVWGQTKKIKVPGTNKRITRPRPASEWRIREHPELRIISDELWARTQAAIKAKQEKYGSALRQRTLESRELQQLPAHWFPEVQRLWRKHHNRRRSVGSARRLRLRPTLHAWHLHEQHSDAPRRI